MSAFTPPGVHRMRNRFVVFGLALVILGWVVLLADLLLSNALLTAGSLVVVLSLKTDITTFGQTTILTGLGLSVLGGLREGFGALNSFFDAVLQRSTVSRPAPMPDPSPVVDEHDIVTMPHPPERMGAERNVAPAPVRDRNYTIRSDGSVEVDTFLGTRVFASMDEARDFIR